MRVLTYNVHMFCDAPISELAAELTRTRADVVCLQEVNWAKEGRDIAGARTGLERHRLQVLAEESGLPFVSTAIPHRWLGNAILSRFPFAWSGWVLLDAAERYTREHRSAVVAVVRVPGAAGDEGTSSAASSASSSSSAAVDGGLVVACCHLDHQTEDARAAQAAQLLSALGSSPTPLGLTLPRLSTSRRPPAASSSSASDGLACTGPPHVLVGDFNAVCRADYPEALWTQVQQDRARLPPATGRVLRSLLLPHRPSAAGGEWGAGYVDAGRESWSGLVRVCRSEADKGDDEAAGSKGVRAGAGEAKAASVLRSALGVRGSGRSSHRSLIAGAVNGGEGGTTKRLDQGWWNGTTAKSRRMWRRQWLAPAQGVEADWDDAATSSAPAVASGHSRGSSSDAVVGPPLWSTCRYGTRIDHILVHSGASEATPMPAAPAAADESAPSTTDAAPAVRVGPEVQPDPTPVDELAAKLRGSCRRLLVPTVVPGGYAVLRGECSDHEPVLCDFHLM